MKTKKYYLVVMQRWGESSGHSYTLSLASDPLTAKISGKIHHYYRGGKYDPKIIELELREQDTFWLVEQFDGDREFLKVRVCHSEQSAEEAKREKSREKVEIKKLHPEKIIDGEEIIKAHEYLSAFSTEEQEYLRNAYERLIRNNL